jgi:hypothetical protein
LEEAVDCLESLRRKSAPQALKKASGGSATGFEESLRRARRRLWTAGVPPQLFDGGPLFPKTGFFCRDLALIFMQEI